MGHRTGIQRRAYWAWYRTTDMYKARVTQRRKYSTSRRENLKRLSDQLKNKPCADCQGWYEPCQMQFDHRDPSKKILEIGQMVSRNSAVSSILEEAKKCDVVCANCHMLRTHKQRQLGLIHAGRKPLMVPQSISEFAPITA